MRTLGQVIAAFSREENVQFAELGGLEMVLA